MVSVVGACGECMCGKCGECVCVGVGERNLCEGEEYGVCGGGGEEEYGVCVCVRACMRA